MIHNKQNRIMEQIHKFLFQFGTPPFFVIKRIIMTASDKCQVSRREGQERDREIGGE